MTAHTADEIAEFIAPFVQRAGIPSLRIEVEPEGEAPFDQLPVANVYVELGDLHAFAVHEMMVKVEREMSREFGSPVRSGYYSAETGEDDIAPGQALLQFDQLPFTLDAVRGHAFRA
jgi:hypothetical protein